MRFILVCLLLISFFAACNRKENLGPRTVVTRTTTAHTTVAPPADSALGPLFAFLQSKGFKGEFVALPTASVAGAGERGSFQGPGFAVTFYHFADANLASSLASSGLHDKKCYSNGPFLMEVGMADESLVDAFLAYQ